MTLNEYQQAAMATCMPSCENFSYMMLNLVGEVGELSSKVAKMIRRGEARLNNNVLTLTEVADYSDDVLDEFVEGMLGELGDVLWQLSGLAKMLGADLEDVARYNLAKLASRKKRGVIDGEGDYR